MVLVEGSCTLHVPRETAFREQLGTVGVGTYIKYGIFSVGGHDWEIHVYPDGAGTLSLHLCLLSATPTEVPRTEIWTNPDFADQEIDYANNIHKPNVPKEIDSVTIPPSSDKNKSVFIKVVLTVSAADKPAKPNNQWNTSSADISFDVSSGRPFSISADPPGQWNPGSAFFDTSKPTAAWNPGKADISFDNAKSS